MTADKIKEVCTIYINRLARLDYPISRLDEDEAGAPGFALGKALCLPHVLWMCLETKNLADQGRLEKAFRWLGFIQGALWAFGLYSVNDLKSHNMPPGEEFQR